MNIIKKFKSIIKMSDFFYSTEMLRYQEDTQYKTFTGGLVSLGIITTIIVGFANMIINTIDLNTFIISTQTIKNSVPPPSEIEMTEESKFRFAIEIYRVNLSDTKRYFDITFNLSAQQYGTVVNQTPIAMQTCTKQYFKDYSDIVNNFDSLETGYWLCPALNTTLHLQGKYSSANYNQYIITVSACKNETDPSRPCASPDQIQQLFSDRQNFFYLDFYFTNTQINPDKKQYKEYYIEDGSYALFGANMGSETFLYFTDYTVSTDYSIWPFQKISEDKGCLAQSLAINHPYQTSINGTFITFNIVKSSDSIVYVRQVQKLSAVFSFIGGMIGAVFAVLFMLKVYTSNSFQFSIAFEIFKPKQDQEKRDQVDLDDTSLVKKKNQSQKPSKDDDEPFTMSFLYFIRYYSYLLSQKFGCRRDSPQMKHAKECKQEIVKQLDVKILLKRIIFIEHCLTHIMDDSQIDALQLKKPQSPEQVKKIRSKCQSVLDYKQNQSGLSEKKKEISIEKHQNQEQMPNALSPKLKNITYEGQSMLYTAKGLKQKTRRFEKNQLIIADLQSLDEDKKSCESTRYQDKTKYQANKIKDIHKRQNTRNSFLLELKKNAQSGNFISNRIWNNLDKNIRKSIVNPVIDLRVL